jgi:phosphoribosylformylglycinamidine (FGAM) synthase-like enzyme
MPETAIKFGSYEAAKRAFANMEGHNEPKMISSYSKFAAGGLAGMIAQYVYAAPISPCHNVSRDTRLTLLQILCISTRYVEIPSPM